MVASQGQLAGYSSKSSMSQCLSIRQKFEFSSLKKEKKTTKKKLVFGGWLSVEIDTF